MNLVSALWYGSGFGARAGRLMLRPLERAFGSVVDYRNARFDVRGRMRMALPALSIGNLTVGGTGKTPMAAWCSARLREFGARPAIILRGYGDDEWRVHEVLNPAVPVLVSPDRIRAARGARERGADVVVLDDAFQHRRASRVADIVLVSADQWTGAPRMLPAGPFREPMRALRRATVAVVTVKAADDAAIRAVANAIAIDAPDVPIAIVRFGVRGVYPASSLGAVGSAMRAAPRADWATLDDAVPPSHTPEWLAGRRIVIGSAIGDPSAFAAQLVSHGAHVVQAVVFGDHHQFTTSDAAHLARLAERADAAVCTLKDAVKLHRVWPREAPPLWYVSQSVVVDRGAEALDRALARVLAARSATVLTAG